MSSVPWPPSFDALLRSYLKLDEGEEITPEMKPVDHGLESMATVSLLLDLEERYSVTIPDDQLTTIASADVARLWALLESAGAVSPDHCGRT
jgi:acyl carrier protein